MHQDTVEPHGGRQNHELLNQKPESRFCGNERNHTDIKSQTFVWKGENVEFESVVTLETGSKWKFIIEEGNNVWNFLGARIPQLFEFCSLVLD